MYSATAATGHSGSDFCRFVSGERSECWSRKWPPRVGGKNEYEPPSVRPCRIESGFKICVRELVEALTAVELSARCIFYELQSRSKGSKFDPGIKKSDLWAHWGKKIHHVIGGHSQEIEIG